ncbi:MAG: hypothetical protein ACREHG_09175, partial [Candidatus Saccharimonadales bacterium]
MATLAPELPQIPGPQGPNFTSFIWSRPASEPRPDESGKIMGESIAGAIKAGVGTIDEVVKNTIQDKVYNQADQQRDAFTSALAATKQELQSGKGSQPGQQLNILPGKETNTSQAPALVKSGIQDVQNLHGALMSKKVSPTQYLSNLTTIAKNLRSTFPGYRDFIDRKISEVTGGNPANELVKSYMSDIAQQMTSGKAAQEKITSQMYDLKGAPGWAAWMQRWNSGNATVDDMNAYIGRVSADKWNTQQIIEHAKATTDAINATKTETAYRFQPALDHEATSLLSQSLQSIFTGGGNHKFSDLPQILGDYAEGKTKVSAEQLTTWGQQIQAVKGKLQQQLLTWANSTKVHGNLTMTDMLGGPENVNKAIAARLQQLDELSGMISKGDISGVAYIAQHINAMHTDDKEKVLSDPRLGPSLRMMSILREELPGTVYSAVVNNSFLGNMK